MTAAENIRRYALRMAVLWMAGGMVVAVTYQTTPAHDLKRAELARSEQASSRRAISQSDVPAPGSEEALRRVIDGMGRGNPDYSRLSEGASGTIRQHVQQYRVLMARLGPLQEVSFLGVNRSSDIYRATFTNGSLIWGISLGKEGRIESLRIAAPEGPTPQDWIDSYALTAAGKSTGRVVLAFAKFLAVVGLGRLAGIRL